MWTRLTIPSQLWLRPWLGPKHFAHGIIHCRLSTTVCFPSFSLLEHRLECFLASILIPAVSLFLYLHWLVLNSSSVVYINISLSFLYGKGRQVDNSCKPEICSINITYYLCYEIKLVSNNFSLIYKLLWAYSQSQSTIKNLLPHLRWWVGFRHQCFVSWVYRRQVNRVIG